jgi:hypothetical protein
MRQRHQLILIPAILLATAVSGCASHADSSSPVTASFNGAYFPASAGAIGAIAFTDDHGYMLMPTGCAARSCTETGTYALDDSGTILSLTQTTTGSVKSLEVHVLGTTSTGAHGVATQSLITPGEAPLLGAPQKLLEEITSVLIEDEEMHQASDEAASSGESATGKDAQVATRADCLSGIPTGHTLADASAAYWARCPQGVLS